MTKRLLDCGSSDFSGMTRRDIIESVAHSEGRVLVAEVIGAFLPLLPPLTNAELAAAFGADILLLNFFDVFQPVVYGLPEGSGDAVISELKRLTGRLIGVNLEPVDAGAALKATLSPGRLATVDAALAAKRMGADWILLTGNPNSGVSNQSILQALAKIRAGLGDDIVLAAGRMHAAGVFAAAGEPVVSRRDVQLYAEAGCDIILLPAPGTTPGVTLEQVRDLITCAHQLGMLAMTAIGTSQEGADPDTIRRIALWAKMAGADLHHIGDAGYPGIAIPENIMDYSIAIRGRRHTYTRMARSINR